MAETATERAKVTKQRDNDGKKKMAENLPELMKNKKYNIPVVLGCGYSSV